MLSLEQSLTGLCPQLAVTLERQRRRWLHWLHGCTGSRTRLTLAASAESAGAGKPQLACQPAGQRRLTLPGDPADRRRSDRLLRPVVADRRTSSTQLLLPAAAGISARSSDVSEPTGTVARTAVAAVITVTVAIVIVVGSAVTATTATNGGPCTLPACVRAHAI